MTEADRCDLVALIADGRVVALGQPEALRRLAAGGDVIELETAGPFEPRDLAGSPGVRSIERTGPRAFRVVADDAGSLLASLDDLVGAAGGRLTAARESRLVFDDVFARLVERASEQQDRDGETPDLASTAA